MKLSSYYLSKIEACCLMIKYLGISVNEILFFYKGQNFRDSKVQKEKVFTEILNSNISDFNLSFLNKRCDLIHHRDKRQSFEYGVDLVLGWMIEDAILHLLKKNGRRCMLNGEDRYREFLTALEISTQPDIKIIKNNGEISLLEIFSDWGGIWRKYNHADLRDNKFLKLQREKAILLGISPRTNEGFLIDFEHNHESFQKSYIKGYNKMGYTHKNIRTKLLPINQILSDLLSL